MDYPLIAPKLIFGSSLENAIPVDTFSKKERAFITFQRTSRPLSTGARPSGTKSRIHWDNWQVTCLLEAKKLEWDEHDTLAGRGHILGAAAKWQKIAEVLNTKGIFYDETQLKNKWNSVLGEYKGIKDHQKKSENVAFESMSRAKRKTAGY